MVTLDGSELVGIYQNVSILELLQLRVKQVVAVVKVVL